MPTTRNGYDPSVRSCGSNLGVVQLGLLPENEHFLTTWLSRHLKWCSGTFIIIKPTPLCNVASWASWTNFSVYVLVSGRYTAKTPWIRPLRTNSCWSFCCKFSWRQSCWKCFDFLSSCCGLPSQNLLCSLSSSVVRGLVFLHWFGLLVLRSNLAIQAETCSTRNRLNLLRILAKASTFSSDASLNTWFSDSGVEVVATSGGQAFGLESHTGPYHRRLFSWLTWPLRPPGSPGFPSSSIST